MTSKANQLNDELCAEIDFLREQLTKAQDREKYWREDYAKLQNQCIADNQKTIGTLLVHALKIPKREVAPIALDGVE